MNLIVRAAPRLRDRLRVAQFAPVHDGRHLDHNILLRLVLIGRVRVRVRARGGRLFAFGVRHDLFIGRHSAAERLDRFLFRVVSLHGLRTRRADDVDEIKLRLGFQ